MQPPPMPFEQFPPLLRLMGRQALGELWRGVWDAGFDAGWAAGLMTGVVGSIAALVAVLVVALAILLASHDPSRNGRNSS